MDGVQSCTASWSAEQIWTDRGDRYDQFSEQVVQECIVSQLLLECQMRRTVGARGHHQSH